MKKLRAVFSWFLILMLTLTSVTAQGPVIDGANPAPVVMENREVPEGEAAALAEEAPRPETAEEPGVAIIPEDADTANGDEPVVSEAVLQNVYAFYLDNRLLEEQIITDGQMPTVPKTGLTAEDMKQIVDWEVFDAEDHFIGTLAFDEPIRVDTADLHFKVHAVKEQSGATLRHIVRPKGPTLRSIIQPVVPIHTYNFYVDGELVRTQRIKNNEKPLRPKSPEKENLTFTGWYIGENLLDFDKPVAVTENKTVDVHAKFQNAIRVYFFNEYDEVIRSKEVEAGETTNDEDVPLIVVGADKVFKHWSTTKPVAGEEPGPAFDFNTPITGRTFLYPVLDSGYYVNFYTHGGNAMVSLIVAKNGNLTGENTPAVPTKPGYTFKHWSETEDGPAYDLNAPIMETKVLHAVWTPNEHTKYTVVYWQEKPNEDGYSYVETKTKTGVTGGPAVYDAKTYADFSLNTEKTGTPGNILGDGSTVTNVYYDRDRYTLSFHEKYASSPIAGLEFDNIKWGADTAQWWDQAIALKPSYVWSAKTNAAAPWYSGAPEMPKKHLKIYGEVGGKYKYRVIYKDKDTKEKIKDDFIFTHYSDDLSTTVEDYIAIPGFDVIIPWSSNSLIERFKWNSSTGYREVTIYYDRNSYRILFGLNDNTGNTVQSEAIPFDADIGDKALSGYEVGITTRGDGFIFDGWFDNQGLAGEAYDFTGKKMPPHNLVLYGKWKAPTHTVKAHNENSTTSPTKDVIVDHLSTISDEQLAEFNAYRIIPEGLTEDDFIAWYSYLGGRFVRHDFAATVKDDIELFPVWNSNAYVLTFKLNAGTGNAPEDGTKYVHGTYAQLPSAEGMEAPPGKHFIGWQIVGGDGTIYQPHDKIQMIRDTDVNAVWGEMDLPTKLVYKANYADGPADVIKEEIPNNGTVQTEAATTFTRVGWDFTGWNTAADGSGTAYAAGEDIQLDRLNEDDENILYAQWKKTLISVTAKKEWVGGPAEKPTIYFTLWRRIPGATPGVNLVNEKVEGVEIKTLPNGTTEVTWDNLIKYDETHEKDWVYYVKETDADGTSWTPEDYYKVEESAIDNDTKVINSYCRPKTVTKTWVNGPKPDTLIELWRKVGEDGEGEKVRSFTATEAIPSKTFKRLPDKDIENQPYIYYIVEPNPGTGYAMTSEIESDELNWTANVTNTYTVPTNGTFTAEKTWTGDANVTRPTVLFTLYRQVEGGAEEAVPGAEVKEITAAQTTATWTGLEETDINGKKYTFSVKETVKTADILDDNWVFGEYMAPEEGGTGGITNRVIENGNPEHPDEKVAKLTLKKVLENEPTATRAARRMRRGAKEPLVFTLKVTGPYNYEKIVDIKAGETVVLENLYYGEYTVEETQAHGYTPTYAPGTIVQLQKMAPEATVTVTNKNVIPGGDDPENPNIIDVTVNKVWVNGAKPDTIIELWRQGLAVDGVTPIDEKVDIDAGTFTANADTTSHTFKGLAKHDPSGREFTYYAKEPTVPANYTATYSEDKLTVTNTYAVPTAGEFTAEKKWVGDENVTRPTVLFTLYRQVEGGAEEAVPGAEAKEMTAAQTTATWTGLEETDINGNKYTFSVKETVKTADILDDNWVFGEYMAPEEGGTGGITNRVIENGNPEHPDEKVAKLTLMKVLENEPTAKTRMLRGAAQPLVFTLKVTGPYNYEKTVDIKAGETVVLENLYYGEYTVEETQAHGYTPTYTPGTTVQLQKTAPEATVTVTNKNIIPGGDDPENPNIIDVTVNKVWVNGAKPDTIIELWRQGLEVDGVTAIDEKVTVDGGQFTANAETTSHTFKGLAKHDPSGREFTYYAKEPTAPANYTATYSEDKLTVTNTYTIPTAGEFTAEKKWTGDETVTRPTVLFTLYRQVEGGAEEAVPGAEAKEITAAQTTATWTGLEETDINGKKYTFSVKETVKEADILDDNWVFGEYVPPLADENGSIRNRVINSDEKIGKLAIHKVLLNEPFIKGGETPLMRLMERMDGDVDASVFRLPGAYRGVLREPVANPLVFQVKVTGPYGYEELIDIKAGETKILENLYYGEYMVEETQTHGYTPDYTPEAKVALTKTTPKNHVTVTNRNNDGANIIDITVNKTWVNGAKPDTVIELWRQGLEADGVTAIDEKVLVDGGQFTANAGTTSHTFKGLAKHDSSGREFTYYAKEPTVPANYTATYSEDKLTVTNTYAVPTAGEFTAEKKWVGDENVTRPTVLFTLYRQVEGGAEEAVPGAEAKEMTAAQTTATWTGLEETDINGNKYTFSVKETVKTADILDDNWVFGEYMAPEEGGTGGITNRVIENGNPEHPDEKVAKLTLMKVLENEPTAKTRMLRGAAQPLVFTLKVTGPYNYEKTVDIKAGETVVLENLYYGEYTVEETQAHGYTPTYTPGTTVQLQKTAPEATVTVTNKNIIPGGDDPENPNIIDVTVNKVWVNGAKPDTIIELWRQGLEVDGVTAIDEKVTVDGGQFMANAETTSHTFKGLAKHDPSGRPFVYYAKEPDVPANYTATYSEDKLTVTNTYAVPMTGEFTAEKKWVGDENVTRPTVLFTLYRQVEGGAEEAVPGAEAKEITAAQTTATWTGLEETDINGKKYTFSVKETVKTADILDDNWVFGEYVAPEEGGTGGITNRVIENGNPEHPDEKVAKLTLKKVLDNEPTATRAARRMRREVKEPLVFTLKVTGPYNYEKTVDIKAGETVVLENLYYGEYTVEETQAHGYTPTYAPGATVQLQKNDTGSNGDSDEHQ
ncbi:MAG: Cna B-type domain-containing protein [Eubacteriales bacterium]|nr:Cna B-type domain-containing protein [Eubacteriales bacterium]